MTFDLSQYELNDTATLIVQDATGDHDLMVDGKQVKINLFGSGSEEYAKAEHRANNAQTLRLQASFRGKTVKNASELSANELAEKLAACTQSIENFPIDALSLYKNNRLGYIRKQVIKFLDDDANFTKPSTAN